MKLLIGFLLNIILPSFLMGQIQKDKLIITPLKEDFYVFTTFREFNGMPFPANGLYIVTNKGVAIIDTPWDTSQFQPLLDSIKNRHQKEVVWCLATHSHEDRTGGLEYYLRNGIHTYTTTMTDSISIIRSEKRAAHLISKDTIFRIGQYTFQTYFGGPGHTPDNIVLWFQDQKILYGGCLIKSTEAKDLGYLGDANVKQWPLTIKNIQKKFGKPLHVIPGHQDWTSNRSLEHTLQLLKDYSKTH